MLDSMQFFSLFVVSLQTLKLLTYYEQKKRASGYTKGSPDPSFYQIIFYEIADKINSFNGISFSLYQLKAFARAASPIFNATKSSVTEK